jgi:hypothetical protein
MATDPHAFSPSDDEVIQIVEQYKRDPQEDMKLVTELYMGPMMPSNLDWRQLENSTSKRAWRRQRSTRKILDPYERPKKTERADPVGILSPDERMAARPEKPLVPKKGTKRRARSSKTKPEILIPYQLPEFCAQVSGSSVPISPCGRFYSVAMCEDAKASPIILSQTCTPVWRVQAGEFIEQWHVDQLSKLVITPVAQPHLEAPERVGTES